MYIPNSLWTWAFTLVVFSQGLIALALEIYVFVNFQVALDDEAAEYSPSKIITTNLTLFIFAFIYELVLTWDALRQKNTIQVIALCIFNFAILAYASIQKGQIDDVLDEVKSLPIDGGSLAEEFNKEFYKDYLIAVPCIIAFGFVAMCFIAWKLYQEFAWSIYKHISADLRLKRRYLAYQIYITFLKFDLFFILGFAVQFLVVVKTTDNITRSGTRSIEDVEFWVTVGVIPIVIVLLLLAAYSTRREIISGMILSLIFYFAAVAYFIFKLIRMHDERYEMNYNGVRVSLIIFAVITLLLLFATIGNAIWCMLNFKKGLKDHIFTGKRSKSVKSSKNTKGTKNTKTEYMDMSVLANPVPHRMEID